MIKKTITWKDFNDDVHTEDFYFHLSKTELVEMQLSEEGGFGEYLAAMVKADNSAQIMKEFKKIVRAAYGERSLDGKRFTKSPQRSEEFLASPAYDVMFMELATSEAAVVEFILGIAPKDVMEQIDTSKILLPGTSLLTPEDVKKVFTPEEQKFLFGKIQPMPPVGPDIQDADIPAAFRRPPVEKVDPGSITLPKELQNLTRDELLAAYDRQMGKGSDEPPPPPPPAA